MESPNNPEVIQAKGESPEIIDAQVSPDIWKNLLHTAIVGNGIFPQSFFAQGILLADRMANLVKEGKTSLDALQEQNPQRALIANMLGEAKNKSHNAYGFKTDSGMTGRSILNVWGTDKKHAQDTLRSFSEVVYETDSGVSQQSKDSQMGGQQILHKVFSTPQEFSILLEMLRVARQSLSSEKIQKISNIYKEEIGKTMQKYSQYNFSNIPEGYREERESLMETLDEMLKEATSSIKEDLISYVKKQHTQNRILLERLEKSDINKLFGGVRIYNIHPLRHPDYE